MAIATVSVGDTATAAWANSVANALNTQFLGDNANAAAVTLATLGTNVAGSATVTFTLTTTTRVRIDTVARYALATATGGRMQMQCAYNSGASAVIGSAIALSSQLHISNFTATTGANGSMSGQLTGTVLLTAGTYTAYAAVQRVSGGSATDSAAAFYTAVYGVGFN